MRVVSHRDIEPYVTKDGSVIREWVSPGPGGGNQSLAEARVGPGESTTPHYHRTSEELYLVTAGRGQLRLGAEERELAAGDCALIPPGEAHSLLNTGAEELVVLCACAPPYSHEDTFLVDRG